MVSVCKLVCSSRASNLKKKNVEKQKNEGTRHIVLIKQIIEKNLDFLLILIKK